MTEQTIKTSKIPRLVDHLQVYTDLVQPEKSGVKPVIMVLQGIFPVNTHQDASILSEQVDKIEVELTKNQIPHQIFHRRWI